MVGLLVNFLILFLVLGIVYWIGLLLINGLGLPAPALVIWQAIVCLILLINLLGWLSGYPYMLQYPLRPLRP